MKVVLFAEDHPLLRRKVTELLSSVGVFTVIPVADGREAFEYLKNLEHHVDLVLTDLSMPGMTGLQLARAIRADARLAKLPVIMYSLCTKEEAAYALTHGVDAFLDKVAPLEEIETAILRLLG